MLSHFGVQGLWPRAGIEGILFQCLKLFAGRAGLRRVRASGLYVLRSATVTGIRSRIIAKQDSLDDLSDAS